MMKAVSFHIKREQISLLLTFLSINGHFNKIYIKCNKSVLKIIGLVKKFLRVFLLRHYGKIQMNFSANLINYRNLCVYVCSVMSVSLPLHGL